MSKVKSSCLAAAAILLLSGTIGPMQATAAQDGIQLAQNERRDSNSGGGRESRSSSGREMNANRSSSRETSGGGSSNRQLSAGRTSSRELSSNRQSRRELSADRSSRREIRGSNRSRVSVSSRREIRGSNRSRVSVSSEPRRERISSRTSTRTFVRRDRNRDRRFVFRHRGSRSFAQSGFVVLGPRVVFRGRPGWCRGLHRGRHWAPGAGWHRGRHVGLFRC